MYLKMLALSNDAENGIGPDPTTGRPPIRVVDDFYYPPQPDVSYPLCKLHKGYSFPGRENDTRITDYNFLAANSYEIPS